LTDQHIEYVLSGDGFFREEKKLEEAMNWLDYYRAQGKGNIRLLKRTTINEVLMEVAVPLKANETAVKAEMVRILIQDGPVLHSAHAVEELGKAIGGPLHPEGTCASCDAVWELARNR
jgi:hypothetical protein